MVRVVQFWRLTAGDGGDLPIQFPGSAVVNALVKAQTNGQNRYRTTSTGAVHLGEAMTGKTRPSLVLYRTRRTNLPGLDDNGIVSALNLPKGNGLAEATYFAFCPRNVVALLYNNEGPRASGFVDYLNSKMACDIDLVPILREDIGEVIDQMRPTVVEVAIPASQVGHLARDGDDDWIDALDNAKNLLPGGQVRIRISVGRSGDKSVKEAKVGRIRELIAQLRGRDDAALFGSLRASGTDLETGAQVAVNLLEEKFIARADVDEEGTGDPVAAADAARRVLGQQWRASEEFLTESTPDVAADAAAAGDLFGGFVETPDDEQPTTP